MGQIGVVQVRDPKPEIPLPSEVYRFPVLPGNEPFEPHPLQPYAVIFITFIEKQGRRLGQQSGRINRLDGEAGEVAGVEREYSLHPVDVHGRHQPCVMHFGAEDIMRNH
jgi:hypothetical protein